MRIYRNLITLLFFVASTVLAEMQKPNILFILCDDLGYGDISCNGQQKLKTPNIDRIAKEGMKMLRHYSGSTVCAPSRCSLMTGYTTGHCFIRGNSPTTASVSTEYFGAKDGDGEMPKDTLTVAQSLKDNGYVTGLFGKWGLGAQTSDSAPLKMGFDRFFGYNGQRSAHFYFPHYLWDNDKKIDFPENKNNQRKIYSADLISEKVIEFMGKAIDDKKPFFVFYATTLPHAEMWTLPKYMDKYKGKFLPESSFKNNGTPNKGYNSQPEGHAAFAGMIEALDTHVGNILDMLKKKKALENTLILFSSDNGPHHEAGHDPDYWNSNGSQRGYKRDMYEGGIHVPMLVMWKGKIKEGSSSNHVSAFWDFFATVSEITGCKLNDNTDGISYLPTLLEKGEQKKHDYLYWEFHEKGGKQAVLKGDYKLIKLDANNPKKINYELYNLKDDPKEEINLITKEPERAENMKVIMNKARTSSSLDNFNFRN